MGHIVFYFYDADTPLSDALNDNGWFMGIPVRSDDVNKIRGRGVGMAICLEQHPTATICPRVLISDLSSATPPAEWSASVLRVIEAFAAGAGDATISLYLHPAGDRADCLPALAAGVPRTVGSVDMRVAHKEYTVPKVPRRATSAARRS